MKEKQFLKKLGILLLSLITFACQELTDVPPGVSIDSGDISTFAGDTILFKSTVSDELGIQKISINCAEWGINKEIDLATQKPKVFNVDEQIYVPGDAGMNFNVSLKLEILSISGKVTEKIIPATYSPDTQLPVFINFSPEISVEYNTETNTGIGSFNFNISDNRGLVSATFAIPSLNYTKTINASGKSTILSDQITFNSVQKYPATLTVADLSGNTLLKNFDIIVMPVEPEDPISNYASMFCIIADENPDSYIVGYYKPMEKTADYIFSVKVYAEKDGAKIAFVPTRSITGDYFGVSPYVSTKLLNKRGYVQPITLPTKGYYTVSINIITKSYSLTPWTPAGTNTYANQVCMFANNDIAWGAWVASPVMTPDANNSFVVRGSIPITAASDVIVQWFCFATSNWSMSWRPDGDTPSAVTAWYGYAGNGKSLNITSAGAGDYPVMLDMAPTIGTDGLWVIIKKP